MDQLRIDNYNSSNFNLRFRTDDDAATIIVRSNRVGIRRRNNDYPGQYGRH